MMKDKHPTINPFICPECNSNDVYADFSSIEELERIEEDHCSKCGCEFKITWTATRIHIKKYVPHDIVRKQDTIVTRDEF
jgi:transcription elongation factor Elf1